MSKVYEKDFYGWAMEQAGIARKRSSNELDWGNVAEELESLGRSQASELYSRYAVLLHHLLKWAAQPEMRGKSWRLTITEQRRAIAKHLRQNPGLKSVEAEEFADAYDAARLRAAGETDLEVEGFPETSPFTIEQAKDEAYWPE